MFHPTANLNKCSGRQAVGGSSYPSFWASKILWVVAFVCLIGSLYRKTLLPFIQSRSRFPWKQQAGIQLTLHIELDGGVGHPHHVLCNAGQLEVVVVSADVEERQVDWVDVRPVYVGLLRENKWNLLVCEGFSEYAMCIAEVGWNIKSPKFSAVVRETE